jgi:hypothetical protein
MEGNLIKPVGEIHESIEDYVAHHASEITMDLVFTTSDPNSQILLTLLARVRHSLHYGRDNSFVVDRNDRTREMKEHRLREEVHNWPDKFNFHAEALREYHPVHRAEMITVLMAKLDAQGINARSRTKAPAEAGLQIRKDAFKDIASDISKRTTIN